MKRNVETRSLRRLISRLCMMAAVVTLAGLSTACSKDKAEEPEPPTVGAGFNTVKPKIEPRNYAHGNVFYFFNDGYVVSQTSFNFCYKINTNSITFHELSFNIEKRAAVECNAMVFYSPCVLTLEGESVIMLFGGTIIDTPENIYLAGHNGKLTISMPEQFSKLSSYREKIKVAEGYELSVSDEVSSSNNSLKSVTWTVRKKQ